MHLVPVLLASIGFVNALENGLARTPQLGWVSFILALSERALISINCSQS